MTPDEIEIGMPVCYIPFYEYDGNHVDSIPAELIENKNLGLVSSKNDQYAFVLFWGSETAQGCRPVDLISLKYRCQKVEALGTRLQVPDIKAFVKKHCDPHTVKYYYSE